MASEGNGAHGCGVTLSGPAFCRGDNDFGQLGAATTTDRLRPREVQGSGATEPP